ncbi:MAG: zinc/iron-chelating domain-containing protein, partial [Desulfovibrionaceae bacterium]
MNNPDICTRCAATGPTCCRLHPGGEELLFPISELEKHRIQEVLPDTGGFVQLPNSKAFLDNMARLFPKEKDLLTVLFHPRKHHCSLATDATGL